MSSFRCPNAAASSAKLFVQLSLRQSVHNRPAATPILDVLLPAARAYHTGIRPRQAKQSPRPYIVQPPLSALPTGATTPAARHRRAFTTSLPRQRTQALYNPQVDEDGKEMVLEITPRAAKRLSEIMQKDGNPYLALRIQVESGGCHGFQYLMSLVTLPSRLPPSPSSASLSPAGAESEGDGSTIRSDDTIFTFSPGEDVVETDLSAPKIILDQPSLDLLKGSKVDYTMELIGSQFKIVDNPLATSSCGCGTSFDIKM